MNHSVEGKGSRLSSYTIQPALRASYGVLAQSKEHSGEGGGAFLSDVEGPLAYPEPAETDSITTAKSNIATVV